MFDQCQRGIADAPGFVDRRQHRGHAERDVDALLGQEASGIDAVAAPVRRHHGAAGGPGVEQIEHRGIERQIGKVRKPAARADGKQFGTKIEEVRARAVAHHHALGRPGRTRGKDDVGKIVGRALIDDGRCRRQADECDRVGHFGRRVGRRAADLQQCEVGLGTFAHGDRIIERRLVGDHRARRQGGDERVAALGRKRVAERHPTATGFECAEHRCVLVGVLRGEHDDAVVRPTTGTAQPVRDAVCARLERAIGRHDQAVFDRHRVRRARRRRLEALLLIAGHRARSGSGPR